MATLRELKTRIGSVKSSEKITGAMKMISSAKVHKFESSLRELLPYKNQIKSIMAHILASGETFDSPLIQEREVHHVSLVVFGTDDGLCGAYNVNVFKHLLITLDDIRRKHGSNVRISIYPVGKKIAKMAMKLADQNVDVIVLPGVDSKMDGDKVTDFTNDFKEKFISGETDRVYSVYTHFISMGRQRLVTDQMLPVDSAALSGGEEDTNAADGNKMYLFEPDPLTIFNEVLPMFVLSDMQEIAIENRTSEQAARVMAMQAANDNARKLLEQLQLEYNKLRQQSITNELLDLLGGQVKR